LFLSIKYEIPLDEEYAKFLFYKRHNAAITRQKMIETYLHECIKIMNVDQREVLGKSRIGRIINIRHMVAYIAHENRIGTLKEIATAIGYSDHSSVIHSCNKVEDYLFTKDRAFMPIYDSLKHLIEK